MHIDNQIEMHLIKYHYILYCPLILFHINLYLNIYYLLIDILFYYIQQLYYKVINYDIALPSSVCNIFSGNFPNFNNFEKDVFPVDSSPNNNTFLYEIKSESSIIFLYIFY